MTDLEMTSQIIQDKKLYAMLGLICWCFITLLVSQLHFDERLYGGIGGTPSTQPTTTPQQHHNNTTTTPQQYVVVLLWCCCGVVVVRTHHNNKT